MKNWPAVQKARTVIRTPAISPSHQSWFTACSRNARTIHHRPTSRNRKLSMSASPANVSSGLARLTIPAITSRTPNVTHTQRSGIGSGRERQVLEAGEQEHEADDEPDGPDRGLVELQDRHRDDDPADPGDEREPPVAREVARQRAQARPAGGRSGVSVYVVLTHGVLLGTDVARRRRSVHANAPPPWRTVW